VTDVETEFAVRGVELAPGIPITGTLDKIERLPGGTVNVVDYKTKAPMSQNAIMGATKTSTGNEYRQLLFYKLLLDGLKDGRYRMSSGEIDFLVPNASGTYKKERFAVTTAMTRDLKKLILSSVKRITRLEFWQDRCGDRACRYCALREQMGS
jgi:DNA helicase-2/ATP-dependent DNA helicase PcrA